MAKDNLNVQLQKLNSSDRGFEDSLMELPACQWIKENRKPLSYGLLIFFLLIILLYRLLATQNAKAEQDYFSFESAAAILTNPENSLEKQKMALSDLQNLLSKYPELQAKYDGLIGEQFLIEKNLVEAAPFIERTFSRVKSEDNPYYIDYAKASILLTEGNSNEALKSAYALREQMLKKPEYGGTLYAFNLIRIALLEKQAQHKDLELGAWNELNQMGKTDHPIKISAQDLQRVMSHFDNEGAKLANFH